MLRLLIRIHRAVAGAESWHAAWQAVKTELKERWPDALPSIVSAIAVMWTWLGGLMLPLAFIGGLVAFAALYTVRVQSKFQREWRQLFAGNGEPVYGKLSNSSAVLTAQITPPSNGDSRSSGQVQQPLEARYLRNPRFRRDINADQIVFMGELVRSVDLLHVVLDITLSIGDTNLPKPRLRVCDIQNAVVGEVIRIVLVSMTANRQFEGVKGRLFRWGADEYGPPGRDAMFGGIEAQCRVAFIDKNDIEEGYSFYIEQNHSERNPISILDLSVHSEHYQPIR